MNVKMDEEHYRKENNMANEIEGKMRNLRAQLTQLVRSGEDEDGTLLRRLLAELERLENQRALLRNRTTERLLPPAVFAGA